MSLFFGGIWLKYLGAKYRRPITYFKSDLSIYLPIDQSIIYPTTISISKYVRISESSQLHLIVASVV